MLTLYAPANDNTEHPLLEEYLRWRSKVFPHHDLMPPKEYLKTPFKQRERSLGNFIWFFKFEHSFAENAVVIRRNNIRVVE